MNTHSSPRRTALTALLLFLGSSVLGFAQQAPVKDTAPTDPAASPADSEKKEAKEEVVKLENYTVTTGYRSPKAVDQIPGAVRLVSNLEIANMQLINDDATAILSRTIPGYSQSTQMLQNTSENLRGRSPLRLLDGVSQSTPIRDGSRNGTFSDLSIIDHIEVINGPSAAEGIGAAGGIINYITKTATKEGSQATLTSRFETQGDTKTNSWKLGLLYLNKKGDEDMLFSANTVERNMAEDAHGRLVGMGQSGSTMDSTQRNLFLKLGHNFGENKTQRLTLTISRFRIDGKGNYTELLGNRAQGITDSSQRVPPKLGKSEFNEFNQYTLQYSNTAVWGGTLNVQAYRASQAMRFLLAPADSDKQDPLLAPLGTLADQSEINSQKKGVRSAWSRESIFNVTGLDLNAGFDLLDEVTQQKLALTNRIWAPPMNYVSKAPFVQASYVHGPVTLSGGLRQENGSLHVDTFTTTYYRNRALVTGGTLSYTSSLPNAGIIVRLSHGWSAFASYSKGFTLPNIGITLRNVNRSGVSVSSLLDLQAVIVDNKEAGVSWHNAKYSFSASAYRSYSSFGSTLLVDPTIGNYVVSRQPIEMKGVEASGEVKFSRTLKFTALYSHIVGMTASPATGPLNTRLGIATVSPDKLNSSVVWNFIPHGLLALDEQATFGREINQGKSSYEKTHGSTLYNLTATYETKWGEFSLGIENLFNKFYILDWAQVDQYQNYFAGRGRGYSLTYRLKF